ncbi:MAG TPA: acyl-CoA dehydrogenase family protein [Acidimicrobiia bacterium]
MTDTMATNTADVEPVEDFRTRLRSWLQESVPRAEHPARAGVGQVVSDEVELAAVQRSRELQKLFFDGGFAGICVPTAYGGAGLTPRHADVLNEEITGYEYPSRYQVPTMTPCMAVILEFGTHEQKSKYIPRILDGSDIWMQMLSEPSGGSDVAGAQTSAVRDGDQWVLNGSKIWTTGAWWSDWALCLARTNWDVPKHRGLSVFMVPFKAPGLEMHRIEMLNGSKEFCQEFLTDVIVPDSDRIGEVDDGWTVGTRWMFHEKSLGISPHLIRPSGSGMELEDAGAGANRSPMLALARQAGRIEDPVARDLVGESQALNTASRFLNERIMRGIRAGKFNEQAPAISRVMGGMNNVRQMTISFELAGPDAVAWADEDRALGQRGVAFLGRQASCIGGGTTEMSRNVISERVLGMPRERTGDRDVPFREVPKAPPSR